MTPVTVQLSARAKAVVERAGQPGTQEHDALAHFLGARIADDESASTEHVLESFAHAIEERVAVTGYRAMAESMTAEDHDFYDAVDSLSMNYILED